MITIEDYNEKCIAVFGDFTSEILTRLQSLNGLENTKLKSPDSDVKRTGWVFPKSKRTVLETQLAKYMKPQVQAQPHTQAQQIESGLVLPPTSQEQGDCYTKKEVNAIISKLIARIEALETELNFSKSPIAKTLPPKTTAAPKTTLPRPPSAAMSRPKRVQEHLEDQQEDDVDEGPLFKQLI